MGHGYGRLVRAAACAALALATGACSSTRDVFELAGSNPLTILALPVTLPVAMTLDVIQGSGYPEWAAVPGPAPEASGRSGSGQGDGGGFQRRCGAYAC